jgi:hypothetical protein
MTAEGTEGLSALELRATASEGGGASSDGGAWGASPPHRNLLPANGVSGGGKRRHSFFSLTQSRVRAPAAVLSASI